MKNSNFYADQYAQTFGYKHFRMGPKESIYIKSLSSGYAIFSVEDNAKYVNFSFNGQINSLHIINPLTD